MMARTLVRVLERPAPRLLQSSRGALPRRGHFAVLVIAATMFASARVARADDDLPFDGVVKSLAFSPDGKHLVAASWSEAELKGSGRVTVWEVPSAKVVFTKKAPMGFPLAAFSADGKRLAFGSFTENAFVVDTSTWTVERTLPGHGKAARGVGFAPDGKTLAVSGAEGFIKFWHTADWALAKSMDDAHVGRVYAIVYTRDGRTLASAGEDGFAKLWNTQTGEEVHAFKQKYLVRRIRFAADDRLLINTSWDSTLSIRDRNTGKELATFEFGGSRDDFAVTRDGSLLAFAAVNSRGVRVIRLNVTPADERLLSEFRKLVKGWDDDRIAVREQTSKDIAALGIPVLNEVRKLAKESPSPEIRLRARIVEAAIRSPESLFKIAHPEGDIESLAFSPDGRTLATGGAEGIVRLWDMATGREISRLDQFAGDPRRAGAVPRSEY